MARASDLELLGEWVAASKALQDRHLVRTSGQAPTGEYAELLLAEHLEARRPFGPDRGVDLERFAEGGRTIRTQVKARRDGGGRRSPSHVDLSGFGSHQQALQDRFDELAIVLFNENFSIRSAWLLPRDAIEGRLGKLTRSGKLRLRFAEIESADETADISSELAQIQVRGVSR